MSKVQRLRAFVNQRLTAAAEEILGLFESTIAEYEEEIVRQRRLLQEAGRTEILNNTAANVKTFTVIKEVPPVQEQEEPEPGLIKEEQEEVWSSQEEADMEFPFTPVPVKSEDDEEKPPVSQPQQTEKEGEDGEDCGGPDPNRNCSPGRCLQPDDNKTSNCSETEGGDVGFRQSREALSHVGDDAAKRSCDSPECGEGLGSNDHLHIHLKTFTCPYCGKRFTKSSNLTTHLRVHTGEKPFTCSVCNTSFSLRCTLVNHMRVHTGEKPFSCSVCGKRFSKKANLTTHMALHTEEKPFKCSICGKRFTWHSQVKNHKCVVGGSR
ncbi:gastrula zinc finger protein XlCGF26.1-like isoform X2 [Lates japonicus]